MPWSAVGHGDVVDDQPRTERMHHRHQLRGVLTDTGPVREHCVHDQVRRVLGEHRQVVGRPEPTGLALLLGEVEHDEQPGDTSRILGEFARDGLVNVVGGCCGTTPEHVKAIAEVVNA